MEQQPQPRGREIQTEELLAAIGELYVQVRVMRQVIAQRQQESPASPPNGLADIVGAVQQQ